MKQAWIALADGSLFPGRSFGVHGETHGEYVFNTSPTGYQEILTDPSYAGQIVVMTQPHIGNVGVNPDDVEAVRPHLRGVVVRDYCPMPSNWRATQPLHRYLIQHGVIAVEGVDTRTLTRRLRTHGAMPGIISTEAWDPEALIERAKALPTMEGQEFVSEVTCRKAYAWTTDCGQWALSGRRTTDDGIRIVVYDFGVKRNILRSLVAAGAQVEVVPATTRAADVLGRKPAGVLLSNGPGDPAAVEGVVGELQQLIGKVPLLAICLGHQLLARALGARTFKLPFGHHGANQPVLDRRSGRVAITSQNHGFAVDQATLPADVEVTHVNVNDGTVEGFCSTKNHFAAVQYHPEASPGPQDSQYLFEEFVSHCVIARERSD